MRILVTGATGKIGQRFVRRVLQQNEAVRVLLRNRDTPIVPALLGAEVAFGDVTQPETLLEALDGVDAIVHLAAYFRGGDVARMKAVNIDGTLNLARAAIAAGTTRFVYANTGLVYPGGHALWAETARVEPTAPYPQTKAAAEQELMKLAEAGDLDLRSLRLAFVYGDDDPHLRDVLPRLATWKPMKRLQTIHHIDVHRALMLAIRASGHGGEIYTVADDAPLTVKEIFQIHGQPCPESAEQSDDASYAWEAVMDTMKIRTRLGYRPAVPSLYEAQADGIL